MFDAVDKSALLAETLDHFQVRYRRERTGWQKIRCPNVAAHGHADRNPSASIHLGAGKFHCFACGLRGDGFDLMLEIEGKMAKDVDFSTEKKPESEWW